MPRSRPITQGRVDQLVRQVTGNEYVEDMQRGDIHPRDGLVR